MTAETFTPSVETTFLPKTNGMVFGERLEARAAKGRVFLLVAAGDEIVEPPPSMEPITVTLNGDTYNYENGEAIEASLGSTVNVIVRSFGTANPTFAWATRGATGTTFNPVDSGTTAITFNDAGFISCTCTLTDNNSLEDSIAIIISFIIT